MNWKLYPLVTLFALLFADCGSDSKGKVKAATLTEGEEKTASFPYTLTTPAASWTLPDSLLEISGTSWIDNNHLLAIEDLHPNLYLLRLDKTGVVEKTIPFAQETGSKFDIEDVALQGNTAYALWSHGVIYKIDNWQSKPAVTKWETGLHKKNNTEGLCFDPVTNTLLIACKNNSGDADEKKSTRAVYQFDLTNGKLDEKPFLLIEKKDFKKLADESFDFYPSAIAVHPTTHDIYVLSTKDTKGLAQYGRDGKLKAFSLIDKSLLPQPEGLCFAPDGTLYISTEGKHGEPAKILRFNASAGN